MKNTKSKPKKTLAVVPTAPAIVPPPTKAELLRATAQAMVDARNKEIDAAMPAVTAAVAAMDAELVTYAKAHLATADVETSFWSGGASVSFQVAVPVTDRLRELDRVAAEARKAVPRTLHFEDVLRDLREADARAKDRTKAILAIPGTAEHLAKAGRRLLGLDLASQPSIAA